jgi:hypothetical protein
VAERGLLSASTEWERPVGCGMSKNLTNRAAENYTFVHYFVGFLYLLKTTFLGRLNVEKTSAPAHEDGQIALARNCLTRSRRRAE